MVFLLICLVLGYGMLILREFKSYNFARYDSGWIVTAVMSIVEDHDLDLRNQLDNDPDQTAYQTALGKDGQWYPLHELLMPVVTVPFYLAFGIPGCLIFNYVVSILLMMVLFNLCVRHVEGHIAFIAILLTAFPSMFLDYAYGYSQDLFGAFLLVLAYGCLVKHRFMLAGFVWGLATYARLANAVTIFGFILYLILEAKPQPGKEIMHWRRVLWGRAYPVLSYMGGGLPAAVCFLLTNWLMFGSPITSSYDRWLHFVNGQPVIVSQSSDFSCSMLENLPKVLMAQKSGLITGAPFIIVAVAFGAGAFWRKARNEAILMAVAGGTLIALFSKYCNAYPGEPGNRYLIGVAALCAIPLAFAVEKCLCVRDEASS